VSSSAVWDSEADERCLEWLCWGELPEWESALEWGPQAAKWTAYGLLRGWLEVAIWDHEDGSTDQALQLSPTGGRALRAYERRQGLREV